MKKIILLMICLLFCYRPIVYSANITSATGAFTDGGTVNITGLDFGSPASNREFTKDNIDAGVSGTAFAKSGWFNTPDNLNNRTARYTNTESHSGDNSLFFEYYHDTPFNKNLSYISYDNGGAIPAGTTMFISYWVKPVFTNTGVDNMQWKMFRLRPSADQSGDAFKTTWSTSLYYDSNLTSWYSSSNGFRSTDDPITSSCSGGVSSYPVAGAWNKIDIEITKNSGPGVADGGYKYYINNALVLEESACVSHVANSSDWFYSTFGYELSNAETDDYDVEIYKDDIYVANSPARWVITQSATWNTSDSSDVQTTVTQTDTSAQITINQGAMPAGTAYLYYIDADSVVSGSYLITFDDAIIPILTLQADFETSSATTSFTFTGTSVTGTTVASVVSNNGTATITSGAGTDSVSGTVSGVSLTSGVNVVQVTLTDSAASTDIKTINITYTPAVPTYTAKAKKCTLKNVTLK